MQHTAFFGDGEKTFALTNEMILELERKTGIGIAALYARFMRQEFHFADMIEIVRTGLIGGGTSPADAQTLVDTYAKPRPVMEVFPLAFDILDARWSGSETVTCVTPTLSNTARPMRKRSPSFGPPSVCFASACKTASIEPLRRP